MTNANFKEEIVLLNFQRMKRLSLILFVFSAFVLIVDFTNINPWSQNVVLYYKILDIALGIIALVGIVFFWFTKNASIFLKDFFTKFVIVSSLLWSVIITGIDFSSFGFSTYLMVLFLSIFFLNFRPFMYLILIWGSILMLVLILAVLSQLNEKLLSSAFVLFPILIISTFISIKKYSEKIVALENVFHIEQLNDELSCVKDNLLAEVKSQTKDLQEANMNLSESRKSIENEKERFAALINNLQSGVFYINTIGDVLETNPALLKILGFSSVEVAKSTNIFNFQPLIDYGYSIKLKECLETNKIVSGNAEYPGKWGKLISIFYYFVPIIENNTIVGVLVSLDDITEKKRIENDLIFAKVRAEESDRLKTAFLQNMNHEIRTPLNSIMGFSSLLTEEDDKVLIDNYANIVVKNSDQLVQIMDDIMLYSILQNKQLNFHRTPFELNRLFIEIKDSFNLPIYNKGIKLLIDTYTKEPIMINSDLEKIWQIYSNLISNALKYTTEGSIKFGVTLVEDKKLFFVKDTGIGIPQNDISRIFERFYRAENVNKSMIRGTGLGLSIVQELVQLLGGEIWAESEEEKGSTFYFTTNHAT